MPRSTASTAEQDPLLRARRNAQTLSLPSRTTILFGIAFTLTLLFLLFSPYNSVPAASPTYHLSSPHVPLTFIAIGDWGRKGKHKQAKVAQAIADTVNRTLANYGYNPHYVLSMGDNFYKSGVESVHDPHFTESYTNVYNHVALANVPWYSILGNHDYLGSVQAQIDFTAMDPRWNMPATYYTQRFADDLIAIFLDSTPFVNTQYGQVARSKNKYDVSVQLRWLRREMAEAPSEAKFLIVAHHNMYTMSTAGHLGSAELRQSLEPIFKPYQKRILAYLSGHEHSLMHMQPYGVDGDWVVDHFLSGAGSKLDEIVTPPEDQTQQWIDCCGVLPLREDEHSARTVWGKSVHGFFTFRYDGRVFVARAIDDDGNMVYEYTKTVS